MQPLRLKCNYISPNVMFPPGMLFWLVPGSLKWLTSDQVKREAGIKQLQQAMAVAGWWCGADRKETEEASGSVV